METLTNMLSGRMFHKSSRTLSYHVRWSPYSVMSFWHPNWLSAAEQLYINCICSSKHDDIIRCYKRYIGFVVQQPPTHRQFIFNMEEKMQDADFLTHSQLLLRPGVAFDSHEVYALVKTRLIDKLISVPLKSGRVNN